MPSDVVAAAADLYWPAHGHLRRDQLERHLVNAEFNWWLLIVGLVVGASLTWLVMADLARRDADVDAVEQAGEARLIAGLLAEARRPIATDVVEEVLRLHRDYLAMPPPDDPVPVVDDEAEVTVRTGRS